MLDLIRSCAQSHGFEFDADETLDFDESNFEEDADSSNTFSYVEAYDEADSSACESASCTNNDNTASCSFDLSDEFAGKCFVSLNDKKRAVTSG